MYLVDEEKIYLRAFELKSNFVPVLSYASTGKLRPIIEGLRYPPTVKSEAPATHYMHTALLFSVFPTSYQHPTLTIKVKLDCYILSPAAPRKQAVIDICYIEPDSRSAHEQTQTYQHYGYSKGLTSSWSSSF